MSLNAREHVVSNSKSTRKPNSATSDRIARMLSLYALAASVGAILVPSEAAAKVVYTPTYARTTDPGHTINIDLGHNGTKDFDVYRSIFFNSNGVDSFRVTPSVTGNKILATFYDGVSAAAALRPGAYIGPGVKFSPNATFMAFSYRCTSFIYGPWAFARDRYLGFEFLIRGKVHYGWARISIGPCGAATTGYAYETVPNRPIQAGLTQSSDDIGALIPHTLAPQDTTAFQPATLGILAQGASGLVAWRRREDDCV